VSNWRVAGSLLTLRAELDALAPHRSKASDGTIGDARHQAESSSQHNPNAAGVVCAMDLTHDPVHGADMEKLFAFFRSHHHPALWYVIFNRRIISVTYGWTVQTYTGSSPHTEHLHLSVHGAYDNPAPWGIAAAFGPPPDRALRIGSHGADVAILQRFLHVVADGVFGPKTQTALRAYQLAHHIPVDGVAGPATWRTLRAGPTK
jgi:hypothetical protein